MKENQSDSWTWKQLLKMRPLAIRFIKGVLGNGQDISFWHDVWTPFGQLITYLGPRSLTVPFQAKVAYAVGPSGWTLASPRSDRMLNLHVFLTGIIPPNQNSVKDVYEWVTGGVGSDMFSVTSTWEEIRPRVDSKVWADLIWYKGYIPKHAFTMWVANYDRLPTRMRLASWGMNVPKVCCLCFVEDEIRDHLLLRCDYSREVWKLVMAVLDPHAHLFMTWSELLSWIKLHTVRTPTTLRMLTVQATIFHLWKHRNNLLHNAINLHVDPVFRGIDREIRNSIVARK